MDFSYQHPSALLHEDDATFGEFYNEWRVKRVAKLERIFGCEWFKGKKVLEVGCGFGNIGLYLEALGAEVTFSDGRQAVLDVVKSKSANARTLLIDQDSDWQIDDRFDLIVHFGVLYNLNHWQRDLHKALQHAKYVALETAVNKYVNDVEFKIKEFSYSHEFHGALNKVGSLPSASIIEAVIKEAGAVYKRYDDSDLNAGESMYYDKQATVKGIRTTSDDIYINAWADGRVYGGRKFWVIETNV